MLREIFEMPAFNKCCSIGNFVIVCEKLGAGKIEIWSEGSMWNLNYCLDCNLKTKTRWRDDNKKFFATYYLNLNSKNSHENLKLDKVVEFVWCSECMRLVAEFLLNVLERWQGAHGMTKITRIQRKWSTLHPLAYRTNSNQMLGRFLEIFKEREIYHNTHHSKQIQISRLLFYKLNCQNVV